MQRPQQLQTTTTHSSATTDGNFTIAHNDGAGSTTTTADEKILPHNHYNGHYYNVAEQRHQATFPPSLTLIDDTQYKGHKYPIQHLLQTLVTTYYLPPCKLIDFIKR